MVNNLLTFLVHHIFSFYFVLVGLLPNIFSTELYGHVDGSLRELIRAKLCMLFHNNVRGAVAPKGPQDQPSKGLLGGQEAVTARLQEANKADELMAKVGSPHLCFLT